MRKWGKGCVQLIKHHFFQQCEDFVEETDRSAIVFVRRFILSGLERGDITQSTEYLLNYVCPTFVIWAVFDYHFSTNMILKGEMHCLLKLNTPGQSLFYAGEARVNHCCSLLSITEQGRIRHTIKKEFLKKQFIPSLIVLRHVAPQCNAFVVCCV